MQPPESSENWLTALGALVAGAIITLGMWVRSYLSGRAESSGDVHGRHVILEQAELHDFGDMPAQMKAIVQKLEIVLSHDAMRREKLAEASAKIDEQLKILRRLDSELEITKRLREERILGRRRDSEDG